MTPGGSQGEKGRASTNPRAAKTTLLLVVLGGLLTAAVAAVVYIWRALGDMPTSGHGLAALLLGALLSIALGVGLMFLVFYSSRHGHDDDVRRPPSRRLTR